jgi:uncharacterized protein YgiM (DUF1202 family)
MKPKNSRLMAAIVAGVIVTVGGSAFAESIWIKSEVVEIRGGKGAVYPVLATVKKGQELTVVERDGKWIKVIVPNGAVAAVPQQGYVFENAVSVTKVDAGGNIFSGMGSSDMGTAAAAKGLQPTAENYAANKRMDSGPLNRLIALNKHIDPKEYEKFTAEGHVGVK